MDNDAREAILNLRLERVTVTPDMALEWLARNTHNRPIRGALVERLASDMAAGRWQFNGDALRFNGDGGLLDGQHRLEACVVAQTPFETLVVRGLPSSVMETIDTGAARKLSDVLRLRGESSYSDLAAALPTALTWEMGPRQLRSNHRPTFSACLHWLEANPGIRDEMLAVSGLRRPPIYLTARYAAPFAYRARQLEPEALPEFLSRLESGAELTEDDPIYVLRRWLVRVKTEGLAVSRFEMMGRLVKVWNYWLAGVSMEMLRWSSREGVPPLSGGQPEPKIDEQIARNRRRQARRRGRGSDDG
jgi:hypothetical protein